MVGEKRLRRHRSRTYYWRKCKTVRGTNIDSLPDELLLEILARLSDDPDYLYNKARLVCRRWCHLIHSHDFIKTQLHRSTYGLFISLFDHTTFVTATQGRIETSEIPYSGTTYSRSLCSCNGLVLKRQRHGNPMCIINPVIRKQLVLPSFSCKKVRVVNCCCIGYAAASMEYKVTQTYEKCIDKYKPNQVFLGILSVGTDKSWRHVGVEHLSERARSLLREAPMTTCTSEGFIIWPDLFGGTYLTLDVQTEILTLHPSPVPEACLVGTRSFYLSTGRSLSMLVVHKDPKYLMEVWEMKAESGEWRKVVGDIKLGAHESWLRQFAPWDNATAFLMPLGWVRFPEVLALSFSFGATCIFFNLNTQQISSSMELRREERHLVYYSHAHKKSLTWFT